MKEDYVSFEIAKLLKDKGFPQEDTFTFPYYLSNGMLYKDDMRTSKVVYYVEALSPTLQTAMKWLRERYKLNIIISVDDLDWFYSIIDYTHKSDVKLLKDLAGFNSYESACEAAIEWCLTKLL